MRCFSIPIIIFFLVLIAVYLFSAAYTVSETEQVIITQFGYQVGEPISDA